MSLGTTGDQFRIVATDLSDEEVVDQIRGGNRDLFEVLMRRHNQRLYRVARSILRDEHEAEDVLQEAYVQCFSHLGQFLGEARFSTWLTKIVVNEAIRRRKRRQRYASIEDEVGSMKSTRVGPEGTAFHAELRTLLEKAVDQLSDDFRTVFVLRDVEGLSTSDTARCLSIPEETVRTRLHRARRQMRGDISRTAGDTVRELFSFGSIRCDRLVAAVLRRIARPDYS